MVSFLGKGSWWGRKLVEWGRMDFSALHKCKKMSNNKNRKKLHFSLRKCTKLATKEHLTDINVNDGRKLTFHTETKTIGPHI